MITGGRAASQAGNQISVLPVHFFDIWLAAHVEPAIKTSRGLEILVNRTHTRHLAIKRDGQHRLRIDATGMDALADRLSRGQVEIMVLLFNHARTRMVNRHLSTRFGYQRPVGLVQCGFGRACPQINTDQVLFRHGIVLLSWD